MTVENWSVIMQISAILGILAVGQTLLVVAGGIDISTGSAVACSSALIGYGVIHNVGILESTIVVLIGGALVGALNGVLVVKLKLNALVTTLGMYSILLGISFTIVGQESFPVNSRAFDFLAGTTIGQIPWVFVIFVVIWLIGQAVAQATAVGRHIYAIGDNEEAAARAGIHTHRIQIMLFVTSGLLASVAGVLTTAQLGTASPQVGASYLLSVITAVVLGGTRLSGGRGGLPGTLIAIAILAVLQNGFALLHVSAFTQDIVQGSLLITAVLVDQTTSRLEWR
jgi:ribose/xylose/arabinose/galactoside ABC-type transport system permease subunit